MIKTCIVCGKQFEDIERGNRRKICSAECQKARVAELQRGYKRKRRAEAKENKVKVCQMCGETFIPKTKEIFCDRCKNIIVYGKPFNPKKKKKAVTLDDLLKDAKKCGFEPYEYGKYKTMKTLEKIPRIGGTI